MCSCEERKRYSLSVIICFAGVLKRLFSLSLSDSCRHQLWFYFVYFIFIVVQENQEFIVKVSLDFIPVSVLHCYAFLNWCLYIFENPGIQNLRFILFQFY